MASVFTTTDLIIFFVALIGVMAVGLIAGRKEETSEDYFLAGRSIPWWGVAGSIFGSNVSANHMVGMMGIGFSIGFAQSHFELGAIFGLLALCFGFLPVYRKLRVYTLSEYLGRRFDDRSRLSYAVIMVIIMTVVQMVPALYIGSRSICVLIGGSAAEQVEQPPKELVGDRLTDGMTDDPLSTVDTPQAAGSVELVINHTYYAWFIIALAAVSAGYTIFGGLKAVIWTDVIQSVMLLAAGIVVAVLTFQQVGGWSEMISMDRLAEQKMRLYRPSNDPDLPWTGVFTGLIAMHCFYWGTNQFIVQRALGAKSDAAARMGIVAAGFLKLLIPFFAIGTGVAAFYLFQNKMPGHTIANDTAFPELVKLVIVPFGAGIVGLISAGLIGAILSSVDSMMNSAATIVTIDIYQKYFNPQATDRQLISVGRWSIIVFVVLAAFMAIFVLDPNSKANFFLQIVNYQNYLTPGLLVAFILGIFWRRGTATAAIVTILAGIFFSWAVEAGYNKYHGMNPAVYSVVTWQAELNDIPINALPETVQQMNHAEIEQFVWEAESQLTSLNTILGAKLNFFHRVVAVIALCVMVFIVTSWLTRPDEEKGRMIWTDLGGHQAADLRNLLTAIAVSIAVFAVLGWLMYSETISPTIAAILSAVWTLGMFCRTVARALTKQREQRGTPLGFNALWVVLREDRFWAGILCALAVFMHFYFY